jgi:hypothetical protein
MFSPDRRNPAALRARGASGYGQHAKRTGREDRLPSGDFQISRFDRDVFRTGKFSSRRHTLRWRR